MDRLGVGEGAWVRVSDSNGEYGNLCVAAVREPNNAHEGERNTGSAKQYTRVRPTISNIKI